MFDSLFGAPKEKPAPPATEVVQLREALGNNDVDTARRLLEAAGGPCQARKLADDAVKLSQSTNPDTLFRGVTFHENGTETLEIYSSRGHATNYKVLGLDQKRCEK